MDDKNEVILQSNLIESKKIKIINYLSIKRREGSKRKGILKVGTVLELLATQATLDLEKEID